MNRKTIKDIVGSNLCTGCGACTTVCCKSCISIEKTNIGRLYAKINDNLCIKCGQCFRVCPNFNEKLPYNQSDLFLGTGIDTYIGKSLNKVVYNNSQSGGLVTEILWFLFETQKIDAAIVCKMDVGKITKASAYVVEKKEQLLDFQGSCYIPVDVLSILNTISIYKSVAIVGTGCHIDGLISLQTNGFYVNIKYKIGLICDKVLSSTICDVLLYDKKGLKLDKKIFFRKKNIMVNGKFYSYKDAPIVIQYENGTQTVVPAIQRHIMKDFLTSPRCYLCHNKLNLLADLVCGDPWGMKGADLQYGESLVMVRSDVGKRIIQEMQEMQKINIRYSSIEDVIRGQAITRKERQTKDVLYIYRKKGWNIPVYMQRLLSLKSQTQDVKLKRIIRNYLLLERHSSFYIIRVLQLKLLVYLLKQKCVLFIKLICKLK